MSDIITEKKVELGKRYNFPQLSTRDIEVLETIENWIEFHEDVILWVCNYKGLCKDIEDLDTKVIGSVEREFYWRYVTEKTSIGEIEMEYNYAVELWMVYGYTEGDNTIKLGFNTKEKAEKMYKYFCQYKGFEHY